MHHVPKCCTPCAISIPIPGVHSSLLFVWGISRVLDIVLSEMPFLRAYGVKAFIVCCRHAFFLLPRVHPVLIMLGENDLLWYRFGMNGV